MHLQTFGFKSGPGGTPQISKETGQRGKGVLKLPMDVSRTAANTCCKKVILKRGHWAGWSSLEPQDKMT